MPPKAKFSREFIIETALDLVRTEGPDALTSRALGKRLESSARPIFTVFNNMEEVKQAVIEKAKELYGKYVKRGLDSALPFKGVGTQYILFSIDEPKLFKLLFMTEREQIPTLSHVLPEIEDSYISIISSVRNEYGLDTAASEKLYLHLWIYTHGIATLCASKMCRFTEDEISSMMTEVFKSILGNIKKEQANDKNKQHK